MDTNARNTRKVALTVLALGAATAAVVFGSLAAWTARTTNPNNTITAGKLTMGNDKDAAPVLTTNVTGVVPGDGDSDTVTITNTSTGAMSVALTQLTPVDNMSDGDNVMKFTVHDDTTDTCLYPAAAFGSGACPAIDSALAGAGWDATSVFDGSTAIAGTGGAASDWAASEAHTFTVAWAYTDDGVVNNAKNGTNPTATFDLQWDGTQV
ncbi:MAG: SipW-dependent-type signal peptide-containing protein [Thermoleophilia bacterium]|nr:SipW-dependent-type signal peptide-containing protein [Thermoleophilia bacterium]